MVFNPCPSVAFYSRAGSWFKRGPNEFLSQGSHRRHTGWDDANWEGTYSKPTGGILTVRSKLGEPIHKVATRGVKLWKEFDDTVFSLPKEKQRAWLVERRAEIIKKLNADFAKPWFEWKKDGSVVYIFTGQDSQEAGMGMDLYNSPPARAVWDGADAHLLAVYGFSIIEIIKDNPMEKTIHFGGIKGQAIRRRYMDMTYDTMDKDGQVKTLPLFGDINARTPKYTFSHPTGLLFATQFAQI
ncbi:hypothetical protein PILCRDRAFT_728801, partial [Piloderma croceum F 1598]